ncbi:transposable element Tcb2 transposase [Trichonephila clavipes]|nr:transposable element Tcb2 transposase [Trichonephila clavipes]
MSTMPQRSHLTDSEAWRVVCRLEGSQTQAEVAQAIGVSQSVISRILNHFLETGSPGRRPGQGHRRATTPKEDLYLVLTAWRHRNMNATLFQQHLRSATGTTVSTQTVRNRLLGVGPYAHRRMECARLTSRHRRDRREDEIFRPIAVPYAAAIGDAFILMDDNCGPHCANLVEDFFFEEGIVRMEWSACSPDMNPIQHVWDALGRRVAGHQPPPQTLQELERALLEEWDRIPHLVINSLIDSMPQSNYGICKSDKKDGTKKEVPCPKKAVAVYNDVIGGVDRFDQRKKKRSVKWWQRIFYFLIDLAIINSFILWQVNKRNRSLDQLTFRIVLARQLIDGYSSRKRKGRNASFQVKKCVVPDDVRVASVRNHMPKMVSNYRRSFVTGGYGNQVVVKSGRRWFIS